MRLLEVLSNGDFCLTENFLDNAVPPYAILSHTWEQEDQEVTFKNMIEGSGYGKAGFKKIKFCGEQAKCDGLQYVWVDSCCINKGVPVEVSHAIRSMFHWYRKATRCYVYLSDVRKGKRKRADETQRSWEQAFRGSRWFTRGWTLQELLAPRSVEFFSQQGQRLGDKSSLRQIIHEVTGIPLSALGDTPLSQFSINERFSWMEHRQTTVEEDKVYSLIGIFGVSMPPLYNEGLVSAFKRLREEIDSLENCMRTLYLTDPRKDKKRIEEGKGGLLVESYHWILSHRNFKQWYNDGQSHLLWIKGDPGKGKTMLLCGIINELDKSNIGIRLLSYFFCQATDSRINNATAVLRGLLYMLIHEQPSLFVHVQQRFLHVGNDLFEDANAWIALSEIFTDILQDPILQDTYFIVDALDECIEGLPKLLDFINQKSSLSSRVKWLVSSRNWPDIEWQLDQAGDKAKLCLELNAESVSTAVNIYIDHKVKQLAQKMRYDDQTQKAVLEHLYSTADGTFLWVALVCQNLERIPRWNVYAKLKTFPPGLDPLYERMMNQICNLDNSELCKRILAMASILYEPVSLAELTTLIEMPEDLFEYPESLRELVCLCGSFLVIRKDTIYFVHQSAKDYLLGKASARIFPSGKQQGHYEAFSRSLKVLSSTLCRDIYKIRDLGCLIDQCETPSPDPLAALRYSCKYWINHCCDWSATIPDIIAGLQAGGDLDTFLRDKYLYWLEALSLCRSVPKGVLGMAKLETLIQKIKSPALLEIVLDARRFIRYNKQAIETSPLQTYVSALIFSPANSLVRHQFRKEEPKWITLKPEIGGTWSSCLQTFEGHSQFISSVTFSHNSTRIVSASDDCTIKVWDTSNGECLQTLNGHSDHVRSVTVSHDLAWIGSASNDKTLRIWDTGTSECVRIFEGHTDEVISVVFSHNSTWLASASDDITVKIWDTSSGECIRTLKGHNKHPNSVVFSHDSRQLASASSDRTIKIWDTNNGECIRTLEGHNHSVSSVAFSHDSARLASASNDCTLRIWDVDSGECIHKLEGHVEEVTSVVFSYDSARLASASKDCKAKIWSTSSGKCLQTLKGHCARVNSVSFSHDSAQLATGSWDLTIKIWDTSSSGYLQTREDHSHNTPIHAVAFSPDLTRLASASRDGMIKIWNISNSRCVWTLKGHNENVGHLVFTYDSTLLASASSDCTARIWDISSGRCLQTCKGHSHYTNAVAFSYNSTQLASASADKTVRVWDVNTGMLLQTLQSHSEAVTSVAFLGNSTQLVSSSDDSTIKIWDISRGECLQTLKGHNNRVCKVTISPDSTLIASNSLDRTIRIWNARSGECIQIIDSDHIGRQGSYNTGLAFDTTRSVLYTDAGAISLEALSVNEVSQREIKYGDLRLPSIGITVDKDWITYNLEKLIWLPVEYRASSSAVTGNTIIIGCGSGYIWTYLISLDH